jgi:serine/threonine-protein kinase
VYLPALNAATKAIELDSTLAEAYAARAQVQLPRWRWNEAEADLRKAIAIDPRFASGHQWLGELMLVRNRVPEAIATLKRASELDPVSPVIASSYSMALSLAKRDADAVAQARRGVDLDSTFFLPRLVLGVAHVLSNRPVDAIRELEVASALGTLSHVRGFLGYSYAVGGQRPQAESIAAELEARSDPDSRAALAVTQIALGDTARALGNLEAAAQRHAAFFTAQPLSSPVFDPVRQSPRFQNLLGTLGLR